MLAEHFGERLLLKGGTLLSKVDLGFYRMSEDVDMIGSHPVSAFATPFNLEGERRKQVEASLAADLPAVLRYGEPSLDLDELLRKFEQFWRVLRQK